VDASARLLKGYGLEVTSLCRGGFFTMRDGPDRHAALDDNRAALQEAADLGTRELVLVAGGLHDKDLAGARRNVAAALEELAPYAASLGVRLAFEPLHPMFCADRAVVSTLGQALALAAPFPADVVGVVVDTYHVWWDPDLFPQIARSGAEG